MNLFKKGHYTEGFPPKLNEYNLLVRLPRELSAEGCRVLVDIDQPHQVVLGAFDLVVYRDEVRTAVRRIVVMLDMSFPMGEQLTPHTLHHVPLVVPWYLCEKRRAYM